MMLVPSPQMVREFRIPKQALRQAYRDNPDFQRSAATALRKVRQLAGDLGLLTPAAIRIWKARNIWSEA